jgi:hypothetical protein
MPRRNKDGSEVRYLQLAHNVWDPQKRRSAVQFIYNFGREDAADREALQWLVASVMRFLDPGAAWPRPPTAWTSPNPAPSAAPGYWTPCARGSGSAGRCAACSWPGVVAWLADRAQRQAWEAGHRSSHSDVFSMQFRVRDTPTSCLSGLDSLGWRQRRLGSGSPCGCLRDSSPCSPGCRCPARGLCFRYLLSRHTFQALTAAGWGRSGGACREML